MRRLNKDKILAASGNQPDFYRHEIRRVWQDRHDLTLTEICVLGLDPCVWTWMVLLFGGLPDRVVLVFAADCLDRCFAGAKSCGVLLAPQTLAALAQLRDFAEGGCDEAELAAVRDAALSAWRNGALPEVGAWVAFTAGDVVDLVVRGRIGTAAQQAAHRAVWTRIKLAGDSFVEQERAQAAEEAWQVNRLLDLIEAYADALRAVEPTPQPTAEETYQAVKEAFQAPSKKQGLPPDSVLYPVRR